MNTDRKSGRPSFARGRSPEVHFECLHKVQSDTTERNLRARRCWLEDNRPVEPTTSFAHFARFPDKDEQSEAWQASIHRAVWEGIKENSGIIPDEHKSWKDYAAATLSAQARLQIENLKWIVQEGYADAIEVLASLALDTVKALNELALNQSYTSGFRPFARNQITWPVFKSPHTAFGEQESDYFKALEVGADHPWKIEQFAKWDPEDEAGKLAVESYDEINRARRLPTLIFLQGAACPTWKRSALELPPFSRERHVVLEWFNVARQYFLLHPGKLRLLKVPASKRKRRGISSHAFTMLREKYLSMAGLNKT
jgi:hypothetical protein